MSSSVCQGQQQSCLEPCVLRHKLASPPKSDNNCAGDCDHKSNNNEEPGDWSSIQTLTNTSHISKESVFVHSLVKCSSSTLSKKSLEMCTESLGSETGSDINECSDEFSSLLSENQNFHTMHRSKPREFTKKVIGNDSFPPPLSWIRDSDTVQVRPHREDGRLVIKAVSVSPPNTFLQAERVNGRLRLGLLKECCKSCESKVSEEEEEEEEVKMKMKVIRNNMSMTMRIVVVIAAGVRVMGSFQGQPGARKVGVGTKRCQAGDHSISIWPSLEP